MASLHCAVCKKCERSLESLKNFSKVWITRSANQKVSNVLDHTSSNVHKAAMARLRADSVRTRGRFAVLASVIGHSLSMVDRETRARMGRKFELCFVIAKESIPFAKYPALLQLEEHHGIDVGSVKSSTGSIYY